MIATTKEFAYSSVRLRVIGKRPDGSFSAFILIASIPSESYGFRKKYAENATI